MPQSNRVLTLTLHPAIDRVVRVEALLPGATFNGGQELCVPAGKGVNTARVLKLLSPRTDVEALVWLGKDERAFFETWLARHAAINALVCGRNTATRIATTFIESNGRETHIKETMALPSRDEEKALLACWRKALKRGMSVAICGSAPPGTSKKTLRALFEIAQRQNPAQIVVDSNGPLLGIAAQAGVDVLKCNQSELMELLGRKKPLDLHSKDGQQEVRKFLKRKGAPRRLLITAGARGAYLASSKATSYAPAPMVPKLNLTPVSATGCGDAATAGVLWSLLNNADAATILEHAVACGSAKRYAADPGALKPELVKKFLGASAEAHWEEK